MKAGRVTDYLAYLAVRVAICVLQALSMEACQRLARIVATLATSVVKIRRGVVEENLQHAFPELTAQQRRQLEWKMWEHLVLLVAEIAHAPRKIHDSNWRDHARVVNNPLMVKTLLDDRPTVIVTGHHGNFELGGYLFGVFGFETYTVARPLDNPYLNGFINAFRGAKGQHILPKQGSAKQIDLLLSQGAAFGFLADQHAGPKGCWVEFFGRLASTHKAIALFSLANDAPMVVSYAQRLDRPLFYEVGCEGLVDPRDGDNYPGGVQELTQWYTSALEGVVRRAPEQYWWVHRRWKDSPGKRKKKKKPAAA